MKLKLFVLVLTLQSAWLLGTAAIQEYALAHGKIILLETRPVDPRDLLRGDYLMLNYKISDVAGYLFSPPIKNDLAPGTKIFVTLSPDTNGFYRITRASTNQITPRANEVLLRGTSANRWWNATNSVHVVYGIENYFVAEGTGNPTGRLSVQVVVPASGHAKIKQVFVDGKPYIKVMDQ